MHSVLCIGGDKVDKANRIFDQAGIFKQSSEVECDVCGI